MDLEIIKIASDTDNNRNINNHTHFSKLRNSLCGDEMQIKLIIKDEKIVDFGYQGNSCIYCQASASLLSKISINKSKDIINNLCKDAESYFEQKNFALKKKWKSLGRLFEKLFKKKNLSKKECILLPFKTLKKIVSG